MLKERSTPMRLSKERPAIHLAEQALAALRQAAQVQLDEQTARVEERNVWQPESWLVQRCWETLADAGEGEACLQVARRLETRQPLAPLQALYRTARQVKPETALSPLLLQEVQRWHYRLFHHPTDGASYVDQLLYLAASAALLGEEALALACLERIDQAPKAWARLLAHPDQRDQLAIAIAHTSPNPLTTQLITGAIRRFDDAGAQFLQAMTTQLNQVVDAHQATPIQARLLVQCIDTIRHATIVNLQSRRIAAAILGQAGHVEEALTQIATIQNVLSAQRSTGYSANKDDANLLRQVKRTTADRDVDFLVYALCNTIEAMPLRQLSREQRIALADQVAQWGARSDGWTAASAASTLLDLGAIKYAIAVVEQISPNDPARSEGMLTLVRGLLKMDEPQLAAEQAERALLWARAQTGRNPERALTWGLAEIYLRAHQPQVALRWLDRWREPTGWQHKVRTLWREQVGDDELRNSSLRFQALLQLDQQQARTTGDQKPTTPAATERAKAIQSYFRKLQKWAPVLLEGEALIHFYVDDFLQPLLAAHLPKRAWELLPQVIEALLTISGNKHAARVAEIANLLMQQLAATSTLDPQDGSDDAALVAEETASQPPVESFLTNLWESSARRSTWQTVHSIEGTLPLLLATEGPDTLVAIAQNVLTAVPEQALPRSL